MNRALESLDPLCWSAVTFLQLRSKLRVNADTPVLRRFVRLRMPGHLRPVTFGNKALVSGGFLPRCLVTDTDVEQSGCCP